MVVATVGGAVGVTVKVSICPVTVITDSKGVGVHVLVDDELVLVDDELVLVDVVEGVVGVV